MTAPVVDLPPPRRHGQTAVNVLWVVLALFAVSGVYFVLQVDQLGEQVTDLKTQVITNRTTTLENRGVTCDILYRLGGDNPSCRGQQVLAALLGLEALGLTWLLAAEPSPDLLSPPVLGVLGPFFGLLVALLWRESKKRDEAEAQTRALYQAVIDKYEPAMTSTKNETLAVLQRVLATLERLDRRP